MNSICKPDYLLCCLILLCSCHHSNHSDVSCREAVTRCYKLATSNSADQIKLDSALWIANTYITCDSSRRALVQFKIGILITMGKYEECGAFVDSLSEMDFTYPYQRQNTQTYIIGMRQLHNHDTASFKTNEKIRANQLQAYAQSKTLTDGEFQQVFIDLYAIKKQFLDSTLFRQEIDSLKRLYPEQSSFFNFLY